MELKTYLWQLPQWAEDRFQECLDALEDLDEFCDEALALHEEIRALPGHPVNAEQYDIIQREVTSTSVTAVSQLIH